MTTSAPAWPSAIATVLPMPELAPVASAFCPARILRIPQLGMTTDGRFSCSTFLPISVVLALGLPALWDCPPSRRLGCSSLAIAPVQPVWCEAPTPRPLSPWKVFVEQQVVAEVRIALQLRRRRSYVITSTSVERPQPIALRALPTICGVFLLQPVSL